MTLDKSKLIVRYYIWLVRLGVDRDIADWRIERGTNLCAFIQRIIFQTAFFIFLGFGALSIAALFVLIIVTEPLGFLLGISILAGIVSIAFLVTIILGGARRLARSENLFVTYVKSVKRGLCPIITFGSNDTVN